MIVNFNILKYQIFYKLYDISYIIIYLVNLYLFGAIIQYNNDKFHNNHILSLHFKIA